MKALARGTLLQMEGTTRKARGLMCRGSTKPCFPTHTEIKKASIRKHMSHCAFKGLGCSVLLVLEVITRSESTISGCTVCAVLFYLRRLSHVRINRMMQSKLRKRPLRLGIPEIWQLGRSFHLGLEDYPLRLRLVLLILNPCTECLIPQPRILSD